MLNERIIANALIQQKSRFAMELASREEDPCIVGGMLCSEYQRLTSIREAAREQLDHPALDKHPSLVGVLSVAERSARTALFSADIDLLFHKARCPQCHGSVEQLPVAA